MMIFIITTTLNDHLLFQTEIAFARFLEQCVCLLLFMFAIDTHYILKKTFH